MPRVEPTLIYLNKPPINLVKLRNNKQAHIILIILILVYTLKPCKNV